MATAIAPAFAQDPVLQEAETAFHEARYQEAAEAYGQILKRQDLEPTTRAALLNNRSVSLSRAGDFDAAITGYRSALYLDRDNDQISKNLAMSLIARGEHRLTIDEQELASEDFEQALSIDSLDEEAAARAERGLAAATQELDVAVGTEPGTEQSAPPEPPEAPPAPAATTAAADPSADTTTPEPPSQPSPGPTEADDLSAPPPGTDLADAPVIGVFRTTTAVNYRAGPANDFERLGVLEQGTLVNVVDVRLGWHAVRFPDGRIGWVYKNFLESTS
ncbi:MAG: SH3 domain-containing protein [Geminicoccaceae bacterium]